MNGVGEDPAAATPEQRATAAYVLEAIQAAIRLGSDGWLDDGLAMLRPWGFETADVRQPVAVWHSEDDPCSPAVTYSSGARLRAPTPLKPLR